jgi:hypothetical protein
MIARLYRNQSDPKRYLRIVVYRRSTDNLRIDGYRAVDQDGHLQIDHLPYHEIEPSAVDPEFERAWLEHIRYQAQLGRDASTPLTSPTSTGLRAPLLDVVRFR